MNLQKLSYLHISVANLNKIFRNSMIIVYLMFMEMLKKLKLIHN